MQEFRLKTKKREEIVDITSPVQDFVSRYKISEGICVVYVPHATAALTINENADPRVNSDFLKAMKKIAPQGIWEHDEEDGNGDSHIKAGIIGPSITIPVQNNKLLLGTWQGIMLCEFDGPRERRIFVQVKWIQKNLYLHCEWLKLS